MGRAKRSTRSSRRSLLPLGPTRSDDAFHELFEQLERLDRAREQLLAVPRRFLSSGPGLGTPFHAISSCSVQDLREVPVFHANSRVLAEEAL